MLPPGYRYYSSQPPTEPPTEYPRTFMGIDRPSQALRAMIKGLKEASHRPTFTIDMGTFGMYDKGKDMCFGCAATCTLMELSHDERLVKTLFTAPFSRSSPGLTLERVHPGADSFENAINDLRNGYVYLVFNFFGLSHHTITSQHISVLESFDWMDYIHEYEALATVWEQNGV